MLKFKTFVIQEDNVYEENTTEWVIHAVNIPGKKNKAGLISFKD